MLAVSVEAFADYQRERAWTWEHMALLRARPVYGSAAGKTKLAAAIDGILRRPRDPVRLRADAAKMRAEIAQHKPPAGPFDIKQGEGGLIDLEFALHVLQLDHKVGLDPRLDVAAASLAAAGLVPPEIVPALQLLTRLLVTFRLVSPGSAEPPEASRPLVAAACGLADWQSLLAAHAEARQSVGTLWRETAFGKGR
jgi:glutamate-ammonia-ligase adenylyltransferase